MNILEKEMRWIKIKLENEWSFIFSLTLLSLHMTYMIIVALVYEGLLQRINSKERERERERERGKEGEPGAPRIWHAHVYLYLPHACIQRKTKRTKKREKEREREREIKTFSAMPEWERQRRRRSSVTTTIRVASVEQVVDKQISFMICLEEQQLQLQHRSHFTCQSNQVGAEIIHIKQQSSKWWFDNQPDLSITTTQQQQQQQLWMTIQLKEDKKVETCWTYFFR